MHTTIALIKEKMHPSMKGMNITEEAINVAVQDIINAIEIPDSVVRQLKDKIISSLDELYVVENQLIDSKTKRIKELNLLINKSYEGIKLQGILLHERRFISNTLQTGNKRIYLR